MMGAVAATLALAARGSVERNGRALLQSLALGAATLALMIIPTPFEILLCMAFAWGLAAGLPLTMSRSILQENAPPTHLPRIIAIYNIGNLGGGAICALLAGMIMAWVDLRLATLTPAIGVGLVWLWLNLGAELWSLERKDVEHDDHEPAPAPGPPCEPRPDRDRGQGQGPNQD